MKKTTEYKTTTYRAYESDEHFLVDIVEGRNTFEAWIYRDDYGVKDFMFGASKASTSRPGFLALVTDNLLDHVLIYNDSHC